MSQAGDRIRVPLEVRAAAAMSDMRVRDAIHSATLRRVENRVAALAELRNPDELRTLAARTKQHTLDNLPRYLSEFERNVQSVGGVVHHAADGDAARRIIVDIALSRGLRLAVKSKSMTSEEVELNEALLAVGVRTVETDLGEFIVQIDHDRPSHIVQPIIHKDRRAVAAALRREIGADCSDDPAELTAVARRYLRDIFRRCDLGISGGNFAIAETGSICICTNEGNGRLTVSRPRVHIALVGIEKVIPRLADLPLFLKLLARSGTGQSITVYTTLITGPARAEDADGPRELHVVLLDNGRSRLLGTEFAEALRCIRCGGCLNACPVYRNIGGHAYDSVYPGPIGALITPLLKGRSEHSELPRASSLCGACYSACPVKIDIPRLLVRLREETPRATPLAKRFGLRLWHWAMRRRERYEAAARMMRGWMTSANGWLSSGPGPLGAWTRNRDFRAPAGESFRERWAALESEVGTEGVFAAPRNDRITPASFHRPHSHDKLNAGEEPTDSIVRQIGDGDLTAIFCERATKAGAVVRRSSRADWAKHVCELAKEYGVGHVLVGGQCEFLDASTQAALSDALIHQTVRVSSVWDDQTLFTADAGVTDVSFAVAETGSIACVSAANSPRGLSLVPPTHIALVPAKAIVADLCDAFAKFAPGREALPANLNLITGPSKTGDIEGILITGVHGPKTLAIIVIED